MCLKENIIKGKDNKKNFKRKDNKKNCKKQNKKKSNVVDKKINTLKNNTKKESAFFLTEV